MPATAWLGANRRLRQRNSTTALTTHLRREVLYISFFSMAGTASMMTARSVGDRAWPSRGQVSCSMDALR